MVRAMAAYEITPSPSLIDDRKARYNALVLAVAQALYGISMTTQFLLSGLVGTLLAPQGYEFFATLPLSLMMLANMAAVIPAAMMMRRYGRRAGFMFSSCFAIAGPAVAAHAIYLQSFPLFCAGTMIMGVYQGFSVYFRFAAADTASEAFRPRAISWVLAGGVAAAILGPNLANWTSDLFLPVPFMGAYVAMIGIGVLALVTAALVDSPPPSPAARRGGTGRPLTEIMAQPVFITAALTGMISYGLMNLVMTATPLAMIGCGLQRGDAASVIQWHSLAMFLPSFWTGALISRFGNLRIIVIGLILLALCGFVALAGLNIGNFMIGLMLLGLGWNFAFVGATTLLATCYRPEEQAKTQAANDFLVFGTVAISSFASGGLFYAYGWDVVLYTVLPFVALALGAVMWFALTRKAQRRMA